MERNHELIPLENRNERAIEHYTQIMAGVISWYNFKGRLGCWYEYNDGLEEIKAIEGYFARIDDFEKAKDMKEQYETLKEYMRKEDILDGGVLPEYR